MLTKKPQSTRRFTKANTIISVLQDAKKLLKQTHKNILAVHMNLQSATLAAEDRNLEDCVAEVFFTVLTKFKRKKLKLNPSYKYLSVRNSDVLCLSSVSLKQKESCEKTLKL